MFFTECRSVSVPRTTVISNSSYLPIEKHRFVFLQKKKLSIQEVGNESLEVNAGCLLFRSLI